jgi:uncharacterized membrane protein
VRPIAFVMLACVGGAIAAPGLARGASFTILHAIGGVGETFASDVSGDGRVVVGYSGAGSEAFRWTRAGGMVGLGVPADAFNTGANAVNHDGSVIVGTLHPIPGPGELAAGKEAFRWTAETGIEPLGRPPRAQSPFISEAIDVSADGSLVVGYGLTDAGFRSLRWTEAGGMEELDLPANVGDNQARGVSADGRVVLGYAQSLPSYDLWPMRWTEDEGMVLFGRGGGSGGSTEATAASSDGSIIVGTSGRSARAFRWSIEAGFQSLGTLPEGGPSHAYDVSADGSVAVGAAQVLDPLYGYYESHAFIWDAQHGMRELAAVLSDELGLDLGGLALHVATAISADGRVITGSARTPAGGFQAWVVSLPEPSAPVLLASGLSALALRSAVRSRRAGEARSRFRGRPR